MNKKIIIIIIVVLVIAILGGILLFLNAQKNGKPAGAEEQVSNTIIGFGKVMQNVSLSASKSVVVKAIQDNYTNFVSPDLLASWVANPTIAPGRSTSSPWPDRIEISKLIHNQDGSYTAQSNVVEMTSRELVIGGVADIYGVTINVKEINGKWLITQFTRL